MTDLEMVKACAVAMGILLSEPELKDGVCLIPGWTEAIPYDPLHDDAQAMALIKRHTILLSKKGSSWIAYILNPDAPDFSELSRGDNPDLNRAIVTCVANLALLVPR